MIADVRKPDKLVAITLGLALAIGACLRFYRLGAYELTADEAASWYAAAAPTVAYVVRVGIVVDPGRLGLHNLALHFWILCFGDGVASMRFLSVVFGIIGIPLVFAVARELLEYDGGFPGLSRPESERIAALSALIFAVSLPAIHYSREARAYPLILVLALAQVWMFLRAARSGRVVDLLGVAILSFLSVAASLVNVAVLAAQGLWLLSYLQPRIGRLTPRLWRSVLVLAASLISGAAAAGLVVLTNPSGVNFATHFSWQQTGAAPFMQTARMAPLNAMCVLTVGFSVWGAIRAWRDASAAIWLALLWMWMPVLLLACSLRSAAPLILVILSFWFPNFLQRYVLSSIVPFSLLVAVGIWRIPSNPIRLGAVALFIGLALVRIASYYGSPGQGVGEWEIQWREAAAFAESEAKAGRPVVVYPELCKFVVLYYARNSTSVQPFSAAAHLLILKPNFGAPDNADLPLLRWGYPRDVARFDGVSVWENQVSTSRGRYNDGDR